MYVHEGFPGHGAAAANVFDDNFRPLFYHPDDGHKLQSIELLVRHEGKSYALQVITAQQMIERDALVQDSEAGEGDEPMYVLLADEIFPSDLLAIKKRPFEDLKPFLVEQEATDQEATD